MKKNFIFQLKSYLLLFILSLCCSSAWAQDAPNAGSFYLEATVAHSTVKMQKTGNSAPEVSLEYFKTGGPNNGWQDFKVDETKVMLNGVGDQVYIRAKGNGNTKFGLNSNNRNSFVLTGGIKAGGNIMYLLNATPASDFTDDNTNAFNSLFLVSDRETSALTDAQNLILPATTMKEGCYCRMFQGCKSLTAAPNLPATTLAKACYESMFHNCSSLTAAPKLPATTLAYGCYQYMFYGCSSLTAAPLLPATTLAYLCYRYMFKKCNKLKSVTAAFENWNDDYTNQWLDGVASTGTFNAISSSLDLTVDRGTGTIPSGWTAKIATPDWTITTPGEVTLDGTTATINVTASAKLDSEDLVTALGTATTVKFFSPSFDPICEGTLSEGTDAGNYVITVSGTYNTGSEEKPVVDKLKAYQGQKIKIQFPAGALKASSSAISSNSYTLTTKAVDYTIPAAVAITPSYTALYIDHLQAENGFYFYVTAGTTQPRLSSNAKIYLGESPDYRFVVSVVDDPTKVGTNTWKYTAKVEKDQSGYILHYTDNQGITASSSQTVPTGTNGTTGTTLPLQVTAGAFSNGLSQNSEAAINITVREAQGAQWKSEKPLSIDEAQSTITFVPTDNSQALTILDATKIKLVYYTSGTQNIVTTATFSVAPATSEEGSSSLILTADFSRGKDPYHIIFEDGAVRAGSSEYSIPTGGSNIIARISVNKPVFVDPSVTDATATTKADVRAGKTYNEFTYKRNYTGKTETLYVPFDIKPTAENQILDNVYIWKLVNITADEAGNPTFNFTQVQNGATVYANMPYLIRKKDGEAGVYDMVLTNVTTQAPVSNSIESSTTVDTYTFTGIVEPTNLVGATGKVWYVKKSTGNLNNLADGQSGTLAAWRWYMVTTKYNTEYANIRLDDDADEATGISDIEATDPDDAVIYNLSGQRTSKSQRGSISIINGKKVLVK